MQCRLELSAAILPLDRFCLDLPFGVLRKDVSVDEEDGKGSQGGIGLSQRYDEWRLPCARTTALPDAATTVDGRLSSGISVREHRFRCVRPGQGIEALV